VTTQPGTVTLQRIEPQVTSATEGPSVLYMFPHDAAPLVADVRAGRSPRERLYGALELEEMGWRVEYADERWTGPLARRRETLRRFVELPSLGTMRRMRAFDIAIVKDEFALAHLAGARLSGCRLVYLDAMFDPPRRFWRRWSAAANLRHADLVVAYSRAQAQEWEQGYGLPAGQIRVLPFCMDTQFYPRVERRLEGRPYVLAIGRDVGRDFRTLVDAAEAADVDVKLVTLSYLIPDNARNNPRVEVFQRIPYAELFALYARAAACVVPLKPGITYPSGIRAVMEGVLLGVPTIASHTPALEEYFSRAEHVWYATAEDIGALSDALSVVTRDPEGSEARARHASDHARTTYPLARFAGELAAVLAAT
jgi:glycosyltransferase involved in cell wall biosynthesis